ncbi:hypothetical protein [Conexibacter sp. CPCC 206217]|uniref:hypothetical protein n=1 Tax=Conexibacter sp. CPCC 206217 TaxID=3064574 RepID=UPI002718A237|nr:hypothetical protein [Conexibacter sp. CPCC 206217]MDO8209659.1 hypothetical protein [Conexibacter sp. CPCC 206217]
MTRHTQRTTLRQRLSAAREARRQRRSEHFDARITARKARQTARARIGVIRIPRIGDDLTAAERLSRDLPQRIIEWSDNRAQPSRLVSVEILAPLPRPGERFVAQGRRADGRTVFVNCKIVRRTPWRRRTDIVKFTILDAR